jgi:O-antigen/teichoic acid export membrane protein
MGDSLDSADIDMWHESLETSISSFFGVLSDVIHVLILVRFLSQEKVGLFFICYAFLYLFSQISRGFGIGIRKKTSEINKGRSEYLWCGFLLIIPFLGLTFILFWVAQPFLLEYGSIEIPRKVLIAFYFATFAFSSLEFSRYYVAGCGKPALAEKLRTGIAKTSMPLITFVVLYYDGTVSNALYAVFISYFVTSLIMYAYSDYEFIRPQKQTLLEVLRFSKWSLSTSVLNDFYHRFDTIILAALVGSVAVSYYDSSVRIAFLATTFAVGVSKTSNVKMSGMLESGQDIRIITRRTILLSPIIILPLLLISLFNAEYILVFLFGENYSGAKWYLILQIVVQLFQCYRFQFEAVFNSYDIPQYTTQTSLLSVIVNVVTAPFLVVYLGGLGVLCSTIIAEIVRFVLYERQLKNVMGTYIFPKSLIIQYVIFGFIFAFLKVFHMLLEPSNSVSLFLTFVSGTIVMYGLQYIFSEEIRDIIYQYQNEKNS